MMLWISAFLCGMFAFNALPHLIRGIAGQRHMTPFGRSSSAMVNVIWAWVNLALAAAFFTGGWGTDWGVSHWILFMLAGLVISTSLAIFWSNPDARLPWQ